jgi:hypothetical protein
LRIAHHPGSNQIFFFLVLTDFCWLLLMAPLPVSIPMMWTLTVPTFVREIARDGCRRWGSWLRPFSRTQYGEHMEMMVQLRNAAAF